ncbi:MAG: cytochrome c biogenesis protein CcsA [Mariprofundaceae bacterium]
MSADILFPAAGLLTLTCAYLVWADVLNLPTPKKKVSPISFLLILSIILTASGSWEIDTIGDQGIQFSLLTATAIATLLVQTMYLIGLWQHGVRGLGLFLLPVTAIPLLILPILPEQNTSHWIHTSSVLETGHLLVSLLAYAILTLAALHALMHLQMDKALKNKLLSPMMQAMPSLYEIETHLFAQVRWATWMLGLGILTGLTWQWFEFEHFALLNHKVLLALFSFAVLVVLLFKHQRDAWHGKRASHMVLASYILLLLAYFGVKLIHSFG